MYFIWNTYKSPKTNTTTNYQKVLGEKFHGKRYEALDKNNGRERIKLEGAGGQDQGSHIGGKERGQVDSCPVYCECPLSIEI